MRPTIILDGTYYIIGLTVKIGEGGILMYHKDLVVQQEEDYLMYDRLHKVELDGI